MPKPSLHALIWSEVHQHYELHIHGHPEQCFSRGDEPAFSRWLGEHTAFAFLGQAGKISVLKEARRGGRGYWYACRTHHRHTRKRYLGRTVQVTFARLEEVAKALTSEPSPPPLTREPTAPSSEQRGALLSSKLAPPRLPISLVERSRLLSELDAARAHPLTLISASAGSGKTTLLSAWAASSRQDVKRRAAGHEPVLAWLSLEALDNDPIRFWASVIAALRTCLPRVGKTALAMLHSPEAPPLSTILTNLLNELEQGSGDIILILDDYHVIEDQAIHDSLLFLLEHLPGCMHLLLATRTDPELPLSRLRVRGQLSEIRSSDLRFTQEEATSFLLQRMGLPLSEEDVATLHHRTEGWIAGLQLAALSLRKRQDLSGWVSDFAGSYRYLLDYVQQDILAPLPVPLQDFLLQTSILTRMNAAVCQAVTAEPGESASQEMLEELERANLFVVLLDEQRQWYRYHDLFREALCARLHATQPERVPLLHQCAARWYETQGEWREAIAHALAAPDYPLAASLMEQAAPAFWLSGEASAVHTWVLALPDSVLCAHTRLALDAALRFLNFVHISTATVHASMAAQVERTITRLEEILRKKPVLLPGEAEVALIGRRLRLLRALIEVRAFFTRGDKERLRLLTQEVEALPADSEVSWKMIPLSFAFWLTLALQQDSALLVPRLRAAKQWISEAGDHLVTIRVKTWLARMYIHAGQLHLAYQEALSALALLEQVGGRTALAGFLLASLFDISYAWNRLEEASDALCRLLRIAQDWQQVELLAIGERAVAQLALARGDLGTAQEALHKAEALIAQEEFANNARWVGETRVQVWLASRNLAEASTWAAQTTLSPQNWDPLRKWEVLLLVRVSLAQQQYAQAVETLERFSEHLDQPADTLNIEKMLEWMALSVVALHHAGKRAQAAQVAARLFALTEPEGCIRLYLDAGEPMREALETLLEAASKGGPDAPQEEGSSASAVSISRSYVSRLLAAFEQEGKRAHRASTTLARKPDIQPELPAAEAQKQGAEPLSRQELRVLRLLVAGQTYAEMAEALIVSPNTIKTQVSSIYRKLGVSRRAEAIAVSAQFHLL
jgi:LuxR family transcriptional regulator, maltose regulon positive regulatory protein